MSPLSVNELSGLDLAAWTMAFLGLEDSLAGLRFYANDLKLQVVVIEEAASIAHAIVGFSLAHNLFPEASAYRRAGMCLSSCAVSLQRAAA